MDQVVLKVWVLNQEKNVWLALSKILDQEFKSWSTKYFKLKIKNNHDFFEPVRNNASSTSLFNATVIGYFDILTFSLITVLTFNKYVSSVQISKLHTCILFIMFFLSKPKSDLIDKIFIENHLAIKTNQLRDS